MIDADRPVASKDPERSENVRVLAFGQAVPSPRSADRSVAELPVRPAARAAVPILTVLDDGSLDTGEQIRIRRNILTSGRTEGDLTMPNDPTLSSRHAEIRLVSHRGLSAWLLRDQGSTNGTFVRVNAARLYPDSVAILGSRRYRLRKSGGSAPTPVTAAAATCRFAVIPSHRLDADALVEIAGDNTGPALELRTARVTIGRDPMQSTHSIDDASLAAVHADIVAEPDGSWRIIARATRNGVWVGTQSIRLLACCYFQCGEQRFRFVVP